MTRVSHSKLSDGRVIEILDARCVFGVSSPFLVRLSKDGVPVTDKSFMTAIQARDYFEQRVEELTEESA